MKSKLAWKSASLQKQFMVWDESTGETDIACDPLPIRTDSFKNCLYARTASKGKKLQGARRE